MKTTVVSIKRFMKITFVIFIVFGLQSCETEIPAEDITPPKFSFRVTGDGFDHTFNQDSDFDNIILKLRRDTTYDFSFSGSDEGGVETIQWELVEAGYIRIESPIAAPWTRTYVSPNEVIKWEGDSTNPFTGSIVAGSFYAPNFRTFLKFKFTVTDFGGETGLPNEVVKELRISTGNVHHTRIGS